MKLKLHLDLFFKELLLYGATLGACLAIMYHFGHQAGTALIEPLHFSWGSVILLVIFFLIFSFILTRFTRVTRSIFKIMLLLVILSGSQLFFGTWLTSPWDLVAAAILVLGFSLIHMVAMHDIAIILGIAGIGALVGLSLTPFSVLVILVGLSFYDILAVYRTKHMVRMAQTMIQSGAVFGFLIPIRWVDFFAHRDIMLKDNQCMVLGSGDIGLPLIFVSALFKNSPTAALIVAGFSIIGLFITHLLFTNQPTRKAMAALPPIATAVIIGYLVSLLIL